MGPLFLPGREENQDIWVVKMERCVFERELLSSTENDTFVHTSQYSMAAVITIIEKTLYSQGVVYKQLQSIQCQS